SWSRSSARHSQMRPTGIRQGPPEARFDGSFSTLLHRAEEVAVDPARAQWRIGQFDAAPVTALGDDANSRAQLQGSPAELLELDARTSAHVESRGRRLEQVRIRRRIGTTIGQVGEANVREGWPGIGLSPRRDPIVTRDPADGRILCKEC